MGRTVKMAALLFFVALLAGIAIAAVDVVPLGAAFAIVPMLCIIAAAIMSVAAVITADPRLVSYARLTIIFAVALSAGYLAGVSIVRALSAG